MMARQQDDGMTEAQRKQLAWDLQRMANEQEARRRQWARDEAARKAQQK